MQKVSGNTTGVKNSILAQLEALFDLVFAKDEFAPLEVLQTLESVTRATSREISVILDRSGRVVDISMGDGEYVSFRDKRYKRNPARLSGTRCIHTHPGGGVNFSAVDLETLRAQKLDSMIVLAVPPLGESLLSAAFLIEIPDSSELDFEILGPYRQSKLPQSELNGRMWQSIREVGVKLQAQRQIQTVERAFLLGIDSSQGYDSMAELKELARTAGAEVVGMHTQKRSAPDRNTYVGSGTLRTILHDIRAARADLLICDDELSAGQARNLEQALQIRIVDRVALILDIFAMRAQSHEGCMQVELAQLQYLLPRLSGWGEVLSRLGGGIGTRGPGETKLETDRRHIRRRIGILKQGIEKLRSEREVRRAARKKSGIPVVALVGYTNAGKSTLLNALSGSDALAEDKLFATLDPLSRRVALPEGKEILCVDTVGFINKLPHTLVKAFSATLEEAVHADLLLHVVDASNQDAKEQMRVVHEVLAQLSAQEIPRIIVYNKMDRVDPEAWRKERGCVEISAKHGRNLEELLGAVQRQLFAEYIRVQRVIPYDRGDITAFAVRSAHSLEQSYEPEGVLISADMKPDDIARLDHMLMEAEFKS